MAQIVFIGVYGDYFRLLARYDRIVTRNIPPGKVEEIYGITVCSLDHMRRNNIGPPWFKVGPGKNSGVLYPIDSLESWIRSGMRNNTAEQWGAGNGMGENWISWVRSVNNGMSVDRAWAICERGDWLLSMLEKCDSTIVEPLVPNVLKAISRIVDRAAKRRGFLRVASVAAYNAAQEELAARNYFQALENAKSAAYFAIRLLACDSQSEQNEQFYFAQAIRELIPQWPG